MKKLGSYLLIAVLVLSLALTAEAAEALSCTVSADSVSTAAGGTVTVPVRIAENPGFTNFAIALDYDREQLELISINVSDGENAYLCGCLASVNAEWTDEDGQTYGYITCAAPEKAADDGILFTASFTLRDSFSGSAYVKPIVKYVRNNTAQFSIFEEITANTTEAMISLSLQGDFNGDGKVTMQDVTQALNAYLNEDTLTDAQKAAADFNDTGAIELSDVTGIFSVYLDY